METLNPETLRFLERLIDAQLNGNFLIKVATLDAGELAALNTLIVAGYARTFDADDGIAYVILLPPQPTAGSPFYATILKERE